MCGIIGIITEWSVLGERLGLILRKCLERLEYRGYDSVGIAVFDGRGIIVRKGKGKIHEVGFKLKFDELDGITGIGHTRWATHGRPSDENAHPHTDCTGSIAIVHNGVIANFRELRSELEALGHKFKSETDSEVIAHLIEEYMRRGLRPFEAFKMAISRIKGTYAIVALIRDEPDRLYFARNTSPLVIGLGDGVNFVASDIPAFLEFTNRVIVVRDGEYGYITRNSVYIESGGRPIEISDRIRVIPWNIEAASKGGYPHFMLKEIHEQPQAIAATIMGIDEESLSHVVDAVLNARRVFIVGAGTSYHAGLVIDYLLSSLKIDVHSVIASEYKKYVNVVDKDDVVLAISQSGETIDTLIAVRAFKARGARAIAISNVLESAIPRESHYAIYTKAGPEIGVAATKTFTAQLAVGALLYLEIAKRLEALGKDEVERLKGDLSEMPSVVEEVIVKSEGLAKELGRILSSKQSVFYLARGLAVPLAMEGALKLKEVAYVHAEAYPAGESKHGPIALVEDGFPVIFVIFDDDNVEQILGNIMEMKARGAFVIAVLPERHREKFEKFVDYMILMPNVDYRLAPLVYAPPLQLIAYYAAVSKGYDPDKPRNLAKTVTVE